MKNLLGLLFIMILSSINAQSDTDIASLDPFTSIRVSGNLSVELTHGDQPQAEVKMISGERSALSMSIDENGLLRLKFADGQQIFHAKNKAKIFLTYTDLHTIKSTAGASITNTGTVESENLTLLASAGGFLNLQIKVNKLNAKCNAGGKLILSGDAHEQIANASSGANYNASKLYSNIVTAKASAGANMKLWCIESITAKAKSGGKISYTGNPKKEYISDTVSGTVTKR